MNKAILCWLRWATTALIILFITMVGLVCLKGLVVSIHSFVENQQIFNKSYSDAAAAIASLPSNEKMAAQISIDHLEKLQQIQKNAASNDVMSFLYSILSTILVGLCAGFVAKSYRNAKEAKDDAVRSNDNAKNSYTSAEQAKEAAQQASQYYNNAKDAVKKIETSYDEALLHMQKQKDTMSVLSIHIEIVHARASLLSHDQIEANKRIYNISLLVLALTSCINRGAVFYLQQELLSLKTAVDQFHVYAESLPDEEESKKTSILQATNRYDNELNKAIKHCQKLLHEFPSTSYE